MAQQTANPFARPLYIMTKPAGALCNMACDYCYYLEKSKLYPNNPRHVMSDELLERFTRDYIAKLYHMEPGRYDPCFSTLDLVP